VFLFLRSCVVSLDSFFFLLKRSVDSLSERGFSLSKKSFFSKTTFQSNSSLKKKTKKMAQESAVANSDVTIGILFFISLVFVAVFAVWGAWSLVNGHLSSMSSIMNNVMAAGQTMANGSSSNNPDANFASSEETATKASTDGKRSYPDGIAQYSVPDSSNMNLSDYFQPVYTQVTNQRGKRYRCVLIGIDYKNTQNELEGCINDVNNVLKFMKSQDKVYEYIMMSDDTAIKPTRKNMMYAMQWLVQGNSKL
jgi:hypothetical protein